MSAESSRLRAEIAQRQDLLSKLLGEESLVEVETDKAKKLNEWLLNQIELYKAPDVFDSYIGPLIRCCKGLSAWSAKETERMGAKGRDCIDAGAEDEEDLA